MFASLLIVVLEALVLALIWQWDARSRRATRHRQHESLARPRGGA